MRILKNFRQAVRTLWGGVLLAGLVFAGGCSRDDNFGPHGVSDTAVTFTAGIEQAATPATTAAGVPQTRTTDGGDSWLTTDAVGIFMLTTSGTLPKGVVSGADNVRYTVTDASTGALSGGPVYYPQSGNVDFVAYYPYGTASGGATAAGTVNTTDYTYNISLAGQTDAAAQNALDVLYAKKTDIAKSGTAVNLAFGHVLSKVTLNVKAGEGVAQADIQNLAASSVVFGGMPVTATLALQDGRLTFGAVGSFNPVKAATATAAYDATFTALVVPQNGTAGRTMVFTVGGKTYTGPILDTDAFRAGKHYIYPVTVSRTGVIVGTPTINKWTETPGPGTVAGTEMEFVKIPAGKFKMGSSDGSQSTSGNPDTDVNTDPNDPQALGYEKPQHWVEITKAFYMSKYEVTNSQYAVFLNANGIGENGEGSVTYDDSGSSTTATKLFIEEWFSYGLVWSGDKWVPVSGYENHPVVYVTWYGAKAFADYYGYSLPTEAQWEYACRAETTTVFSYGDSADGDYMWYSGNNNLSSTKAVGTKRPNPWGLYDMHGNVSEWCLDQWENSNYPDAATKDVAIQDPLVTVGSFRILRGGFWNGDIGVCRSANRSLRNPDGYNFGIGFRVVVVP